MTLFDRVGRVPVLLSMLVLVLGENYCLPTNVSDLYRLAIKAAIRRCGIQYKCEGKGGVVYVHACVKFLLFHVEFGHLGLQSSQRAPIRTRGKRLFINCCNWLRFEPSNKGWQRFPNRI